MQIFIVWLAGGALAASTVAGVWILLRAFQFVYVSVTPVQVNDDDSVVTNFIDLLSEARTSMVVFDDGNDMDGSLYNDPRVIEAVRSKLRSKPDFQLQCLFNCDRDVKFRKELAHEQRVDIRTRIDVGDPGETHYKMIDGGVKAYLSPHALGSRKRKFKIVDCTTVSKRHRARVAEGVLGKHKADFARAFAAAAGRN